MRFMILIKANEESEAGVMPSQELLEQMNKYNRELVEAGVMLAGEGLHPSSKRARVQFSGDKRTVVDATAPAPASTASRIFPFPSRAQSPRRPASSPVS